MFVYLRSQNAKQNKCKFIYGSLTSKIKQSDIGNQSESGIASCSVKTSLSLTPAIMCEDVIFSPISNWNNRFFLYIWSMLQAHRHKKKAKALMSAAKLY